MEKIIKKVKRQLAQSGGLSIALGSALLAVTIPLAILSIISGAKLLNLRNQI